MAHNNVRVLGSGYGSTRDMSDNNTLCQYSIHISSELISSWVYIVKWSMCNNIKVDVLNSYRYEYFVSGLLF